ncbi:MAG: mechanosensitive ion channel [Verrucomicrobiales bacterium]|nr:mechanosensitive ion channel [Verrucomicrobiales bacterium]
MMFCRPGSVFALKPTVPIIIGLSWLLVTAFVSGQAPSPTTTLPDIEALNTRLQNAGSDPEAETEKAKLRDAIALLEQAQKNEVATGKFRLELTNAPPRTKELRAELESIPLPDDTKLQLPETGRSDAVEELLVEQRADLADLRSKLTTLEKEIANLKARPDKVVARKVELENELALAENELATSANPTQSPGAPLTAGQILSLAKIHAAHVESTMLEQERLSFSVREARMTAERDLIKRKINFTESILNALVAWQNAQLQKEVSQVATSAAKAKNDAVGQHPAVKALAEELRNLSVEFETIISERQEVAANLREVRFKIEELTRNHLQLKTQLDIDGMSGVFGEVIIDQSRNLPSLTKSRVRLRALRKQLGQARLGQFRNEESIRGPAEGTGKTLADNPYVPEDEEVQKQIKELTAKKTEVAQQIKSEYQRLIRDLGDLEMAEHQFAEKIEEVGTYLDEKRIWVRGSKMIGISSVKELPEAIAWLAGPTRLPEIWGALKGGSIRQPILAIFAALVFGAIFFARWRLIPVLKETATPIRQISTDRYSYTLRALFYTTLLAIPLPLFFASLGGLILLGPDPTDWLTGMGNALIAASFPITTMGFARQLCRPGGLAEAHFRWPQSSTRCLRNNLGWILIVFVPALMIIVFTYSTEELGYFDSLGRLTFLVVMGWTAFFISRMFNPVKGVFAERIRNHPGLVMSRLTKIWYPVVVGIPIALAILAAMGYPLAAFVLTKESRFTTETVFAGIVLYSLLLRWAVMRVRKLALEKHLADRRAKQLLAATEDNEMVVDECVLGEVETPEIDLAAVGDQTRRMFRFLSGVAVVVTVWWGSWVDIIPALQTLDNIKVIGTVTLNGLIPAILIIVATVITARNLPGILELFLQRFLSFDAGSRYAATTIAQYLIILFGFLFVFNALGLDWSKFSWIAAALSVGLGFGMQEIVANFVCGIILLFERPIRIGDVVTVSGTTGVVSRIQIRATTITNWDRQEFVVPNKEIVTGSLLNWTLTNPLSRIVMTIGVAYGSDTRRVRDVLYEIIGNQEGILKDPEPIVTFEEFADSTLNFSIRVYIPGPDKRLATLNELNETIHDRFNEEGISIAFPQQDIHIRSIDEPFQFKQTPES